MLFLSSFHKFLEWHPASQADTGFGRLLYSIKCENAETCQIYVIVEC